MIYALLSLIGFGISIKPLLNEGASLHDLLMYACDLLTIVIPPTLPAALTIGTAYSLWRLNYLQIFCISPRKINVSGRVRLMVLDKTGTITED
jgi:P-type E1-E2 ATPase